MVRRLVLTASIIAAAISVLPVGARATTSLDPNDAGSRLDIRSVTRLVVHDGHLRLTLVFWDRTPIHMLRRRAARVEMGFSRPHDAIADSIVRFWPNRRGRLRVTWGEAGSTCCGHDSARHPDPYTYTTVIAIDPSRGMTRSFRAASTRRLRCSFEPRCGILRGRTIDRTRWTSG
jgi:hypothetical protein